MSPQGDSFFDGQAGQVFPASYLPSLNKNAIVL